MTPRQAIKLLNALGDLAEEWDDPDEYLEAIGMAQEALEKVTTDYHFDAFHVQNGISYRAWKLGEGRWYAQRTEAFRTTTSNSGPHPTEGIALRAVRKKGE